jgi:inner membrane protein
MDIVTHGLLGALVAQSISNSRNLRLASVVGFSAALLPDLDVLIHSSDDPLLVLEYHRHFTHSIFFAPFAALLLTLLCAPRVRKDFNKPSLFMLVLLAYLSACLLDACTSYGTHLLWPLLPEPLALSIIAVVDPLFSGILLIAVSAAWIGRKRQRAWLGIGLALCYLALGWLQHQRAEAAAIALAAERQLTTRIEVKPTMGNLLLWRALAITPDQQIQVDAIRVGLTVRIYPGERRALFNLDTWQAVPADSQAFRDLSRYQQLNQPLLIIHSESPLMIGDARYSMLPITADPLWGLQINPAQANASTEFITRRTLTPAMRQVFMDMLFGIEIEPDSWIKELPRVETPE